MSLPTRQEIRDYLAVLLKIWEKTPSGQTAVFNDGRISGHIPWDAKKVRAVREHCSAAGWVSQASGGAADYTLTPAGLESARGARHRQSPSGTEPPHG